MKQTLPFLHPLRVARRWWAAFRYNRPGGYHEDDYWEDRHRRYRGDFRAVASYDWEREKRYPEQRRQFLEILDRHGVELAGSDAIEFGSGNGYWCGVLLEAGVGSYSGIDISRTAVDESSRQFPKGRFLRHHLGKDPLALDRSYSLVFSIDVTQHVLERAKLLQFLGDMERAAAPGGLVFCTSYVSPEDGDPSNFDSRERVNFVTTWSRETLMEGFPESDLVSDCPFWDKNMLVFRRRENSALPLPPSGA